MNLRGVVAAVCGLALAACSPEPSSPDEAAEQAAAAGSPRVHRLDGYVGSDACAGCHDDEHATWSRTHHRSMTRRPTPGTVVGAFDGREVAYSGNTARVVRDGDRFVMEVSEDEGTRRAEVALVVGSRRYQQYFERVEHESGERLERLPFLWHVEEERWLHLNTVFLGPDHADQDRHRALWNANCVFCHNTAPRPGIADAAVPLADAVFDTRVAELGIACESCHGPAAAHVAFERDLAARNAEAGSDDRRIVHPLSLGEAEELAVCGQCHGQRMPDPVSDIVRYLETGPTFRPSDALTDHVTPVARDTASPDPTRADLFRERFWDDGTPRLTAYEYQGVAASACREGGLTCSSCHVMHGGDPDGMIEPEMRGNAACADCHGKIVEDPTPHTHHAADGPGSLCYDCHMPRIIYGVLGIHRSHRIEIPDPARDARHGRPDACALCHLDRTPGELRANMDAWWGEGESPTVRLDRAPLGVADAVASLHAGDAVQRAVYAAAFGRDGAGVVKANPGLAAHLAAACGDGYPAVRFIARRSLLALGAAVDVVEDWDTTDAAARGDLVRRLLAALPGAAAADPATLTTPDGLDLEALTRLLELQSESVIDIGE